MASGSFSATVPTAIVGCGVVVGSRRLWCGFPDGSRRDAGVEFSVALGVLSAAVVAAIVSWLAWPWFSVALVADSATVAAENWRRRDARRDGLRRGTSGHRDVTGVQLAASRRRCPRRRCSGQRRGQCRPFSADSVACSASDAAEMSALTVDAEISVALVAESATAAAENWWANRLLRGDGRGRRDWMHLDLVALISVGVVRGFGRELPRRWGAGWPWVLGGGGAGFRTGATGKVGCRLAVGTRRRWFGTPDLGHRD